MKKFALFALVTAFLLTASSMSALAQETIQVYAPPTPTSIPLLLAAQNLDNVEVTIYSNHSQAHTLFLRGDIPILTTGLSVGVNFFKNDVPVQMINSYVSGLTYLVTRDKQVENFRELQGKNLYFPFEGAPIEEITTYFVKQEGLSLKDDFKVMYAPFTSSLELLKKGDVDAVALPQPLATMATAQENVYLSFSFQEKWVALTGNEGSYPQVGTFVKKEWAQTHQDVITALHQELEKAVKFVQEHPEDAVAQTKDAFKFPEKMLLAAVSKIGFDLKTSSALKQNILDYYQTLGHPLDETFDAFFYFDSK